MYAEIFMNNLSIHKTDSKTISLKIVPDDDLFL